MPEAPVLDEVDAEGTAWAADHDGAGSDGITPAEDDARGDRETAKDALESLDQPETEAAAQAEATAEADREAMTALSDEGAAAAEAEALGGLEGGLAAAYLMDRQRLEAQDDEVATEAMARTSLLVVGLSTVAGIAGFKRELSRVEGVRSVGVSAGESGQFIFAVSHMPDVDLASAIPSIETFQATVTGDSPDSLVVTAVEPSADD